MATDRNSAWDFISIKTLDAVYFALESITGLFI